MALTPLWQGIPEILASATPTEYTRLSIEYYKGIVPVGEARSDLEAVATKRINPKNLLEFYIWKACQKWFKECPDDCKTIGQIEKFIHEEYSKAIFDRTSVNHTVNKYVFAGLLYKLKGERNDIYYFELMIKRMGIDWFRIDNEYMLGDFQQEKGLFNIIGE